MHQSTAPTLSGFILTGGQSSRFGSNKAFAQIEGKSFLERALHALVDLGCSPYLVTKLSDPYRELDIPIIDNEGPQLGPVAGWKAGLEAAGQPWVFALSVDMPHVTSEVLRALIPETLPQSPQAFCFPRGAKWHPFPGLYHRDLANHAAKLGPAPSMNRLLDQFTVQKSTLPGDPNKVLININRPGDVY